MPFRREVPALQRQIERAVRCLDGIGMHRLMREEQRERLAAFPLQEIDGEPVHDVGDVPSVLHVLAVVVELRIAQSAVTVVAHPIVVTGTGHAVVAHVPLADMRCLVAQLLQLQVIIRQPVTHRAARDVVYDAVAACVLTRDDRRPVG